MMMMVKWWTPSSFVGRSSDEEIVIFLGHAAGNVHCLIYPAGSHFSARIPSRRSHLTPIGLFTPTSTLYMCPSSSPLGCFIGRSSSRYLCALPSMVVWQWRKNGLQSSFVSSPRVLCYTNHTVNLSVPWAINGGRGEDKEEEVGALPTWYSMHSWMDECP